MTTPHKAVLEFDLMDQDGQSAFAYTWQILGAWGEEMSLLNEL